MWLVTGFDLDALHVAPVTDQRPTNLKRGKPGLCNVRRALLPTDRHPRRMCLIPASGCEHHQRQPTP